MVNVIELMLFALILKQAYRQRSMTALDPPTNQLTAECLMKVTTSLQWTIHN